MAGPGHEASVGHGIAEALTTRAGTVGPPLTRADLIEPGEAAHPALAIAIERARAGSRPRRRSDPHTLALAIEGGGMSAAFSAGACVMLDALGLVGSFDLVYGCSSGSLNGLWTAAGEAALGASNYEQAACAEFIARSHALRGRPIIDLAFLFARLGETPFSMRALAAGPDFRALATAVDDGSLAVLRGFASRREALEALRASCSLPVLCGELPTYRGRLLADGGLLESIPYPAALAEGATHVLVLRSHPADLRVHRVSPLTLAIVGRADPRLRELVRVRPSLYNRQAEQLAAIESDPWLRERLFALAPGPREALAHMERDPARVIAAMQAGARRIGSLLCREDAALCWHPTAHRLNGAPERSRARASAIAASARPARGLGPERARTRPLPRALSRRRVAAPLRALRRRSNAARDRR